MFLSLLISTSIIQVFAAETLAEDPRNTRAQNALSSVQRGAILVQGTPIAESVREDSGWRRSYPNGPLYSAVTGFLPVNGAPIGLEESLNNTISGKANDMFLSRLNSIFNGTDPQGNSVEISIDPVAQQTALEALGDKRGSVVLLEPKTGRILAMVSTPTYDPNLLANPDSKTANEIYQTLADQPQSPLINRAIEGNLNPPGSTFKPVMTAAALESNTYTLDSTFPDPSSLTLPNTSTQVRNASRGVCSNGSQVSLATAQILSCNIPFAEMGIEMDPQIMKTQAEKFGFNTSFSIPTTVAQSTMPLYTEPAQRALGAFGQYNTRTTTLQLAMISSAIANKGVLMYPTLVDEVRSPSLETLEKHEPKIFSQALSPENAQKMNDLMVRGVSNGVASNARIEGVAVGGKTGTAQNDEDEPYTLSFTGFAPANDPQFAIGVVVEDGGGLGQNGTGNSLAAPIAKKVLEAVLKQ